MKIWHVLENAEEVKTMLDGKKYEMGGVTTHPVTFAPHVYIKVEKWRDEEGGEVVFIVPLELVQRDVSN